MDTSHYSTAGSASPDGVKGEMEARQREWEEQADTPRRHSMPYGNEQPTAFDSSPRSTSGKSDRLSPTYTNSAYPPYTCASYDGAASSSPPELRRISGNFNAPTQEEVEKTKSYRRRSQSKGKIQKLGLKIRQLGSR